jgi:hypothetical protein
MPEEDYCKILDFGEGFEHVKSLVIKNVTVINSGYTYDKEQTIKIPTINILSAD